MTRRPIKTKKRSAQPSFRSATGNRHAILRISASICAGALLAGVALAETLEWPQWRGPERDGVWRETGLKTQFDTDVLTPRWTAPVGGGYSGPTVAGGRVYVTDFLAEPEPHERVLCFAWETGELLWRHSYPADYTTIRYQTGPRASVLVHDGLAYSLGSVGHLVCLEAGSGRVAWARDLAVEYGIRMPNWGIAASPLIEEDLLIVMIGGAEACVIALDRRTGELRWRALDDAATYSAPVIVNQAGRRVVIAWTGQRIVGLAATTGELLWEVPAPYERWPIAIADPVPHGDLLVCSEAHQGTRVLRLLAVRPGVELVWHGRGPGVRKEAELHALISTPQVMGRHIYGADHRGVLRCLELETGQQLWAENSVVPEANWATVHLVREGKSDRFWLFNERGELILAQLSPKGYRELSRARVIEPTRGQLNQRGGVVWTHPAFAHRHLFVRNDERLVCVDLSR